MSRWLTAAVCAVAAMAIACSKFGAQEGELPVDAGAAIDGTAEPPDDPADAAPSPTCLSAGFDFCDRFERDTVKGSWDSPTTVAGSALAISTNTFVSATRSLEVTLPSGSDENPRAYLTRRLEPKTHLFRVAFSMRYDAIGADVQVVNLTFEGSTYVFLTVGKDTDGQAVLKASEQLITDAGAATTSKTVTVITLGKWVRFELVVDVAGKTIALTRDDDIFVETIPNLTLSFGDAKRLTIGAAYVATPRANALTIGLDDVFYSAK